MKNRTSISYPRICPNNGISHSYADWWPYFNLDNEYLGRACLICGLFLAVDGRVWVNRKRRKDLDIEPIKKEAGR